MASIEGRQRGETSSEKARQVYNNGDKKDDMETTRASEEADTRTHFRKQRESPEAKRWLGKCFGKATNERESMI